MGRAWLPAGRLQLLFEALKLEIPHVFESDNIGGLVLVNGIAYGIQHVLFMLLSLLLCL